MDSYSQKGIFNLAIDEEAKAQLLETARWTKFLAILGFVFLGLLVIIGLLMGAGMSTLTSIYAEAGAYSGLGTIFMVIYLIIALLYFFPVFYLYKYSALIKPAINNSHQEQFNLALSYQKRMFKFIGIIALIVLALYAIMIVFMMIGVAFGSA